jgi:hypothetical protein
MKNGVKIFRLMAQLQGEIAEEEVFPWFPIGQQGQAYIPS